MADKQDHDHGARGPDRQKSTAGLSSFDLAGRVSLVTGAAGLLGREHVAALADAGATVFATDIADEKLANIAEASSQQIRPICMDVTNENSISATFEQISQEGFSVDILVNNAAVDPKVDADGDLGAATRLESFAIERWNKEIDVGLTGAFLCSRLFGGAMARAGRGVILNIASDLSVIAPDQRLYRQTGIPESQQPAKPVTYSVVKTGLIGLTRYLAAYWADQGVRVNALSPGGVYAGQSQEFVERLSALIPLGRMAEPDEYRAAIQFLCSDASRYMTGQNIVIDGGRTIL